MSLKPMFHESDRVRFSQMRKLINSDKNKVIADMGGGLFSIAKGSPSKKTIVLDGDVNTSPDILTDFENPIPLKDQSVDIVIAGEIVEHLVNPCRFLMEVNRILKKGGTLIMSTPNSVELKSRVKVLFGMLPTLSPKAFPTLEDQKFGHKIAWNWKMLKDCLEFSGFKIIYKSTGGLFFGERMVLPPKICPLTLGEHFIVKAIKK